MTDISKSAFGSGIVAIFETQVFPFMLSSAHTARTHVKESNDTDSVKTDIMYAVGISIAFSAFMAIMLKDVFTGLFGTVFSFILMYVYMYRGELI